MSKITRVRSVVREFLGRETPERSVLRSTLDAIVGDLPSTVIFGGMLREFALGSARTFVSDIDLVTLSSSKEIENSLRRFGPVRNRFGGFRFNSGKWRFDLWSLADTWAIRQGLVTGTEFSDLLKTTFFNLDSVVLHLATKKETFSAEFQRGIENRFLEINLAENPDPERMVQRAIRMAVENSLAVGPRLCRFIMSHSSRTGQEGRTFLREMENHMGRSSSPYTFRPQQTIELG